MYSLGFSFFEPVRTYARSLAAEPAWDQVQWYADARLRAIAYHARWHNPTDLEFCRSDLKKHLLRLRSGLKSWQSRAVDSMLKDLDDASFEDLSRQDTIISLGRHLDVALPREEKPTPHARRPRRGSAARNHAASFA